MGEAKRRGDFNARQAEAIERIKLEQEEKLRQRIISQRDALETQHRKPSKRMMVLSALLGTL